MEEVELNSMDGLGQIRMGGSRWNDMCVQGRMEQGKYFSMDVKSYEQMKIK